jgi:hypothetical protein
MRLDKFSIDSALRHIDTISKKPHSMATIEHDQVRIYIINELQRMGLDTSMHSTTAMYDFRGSVSAGFVHNVLGILKGRKKGKSILVTAHYDSQPYSRAAADDGAAVAAMLEAARALKNSPQLDNDIIFLFSDGEESGLFGAQAFVKQHKLASSVGLVLNLEARGSSGPSYTFEVSPENGWIMREYKKACRYPMASSLAYEVYKLMSNNSDFTIYKNAGYSGFNTAFIGDYAHYHSMKDNPKNLSKKSLYHHATYIMDICRHFGKLDLSNTKADDLVYFNLMGYWLISYPQSWNIFLIGIIILLFTLVIYLGIKKNKIIYWKVLLGFVIFIVALSLSLVGVWFLQKGIRTTYPWYENFYDANFYNVGWYFLAFAALCLMITSAIYAFFCKKINVLHLCLGGLFFNLLLMIGIQIYIPTALFLAFIPLLLLLSLILIKILFNIQLTQKRNLLLIAIFSFPLITLYMPVVKVLYITFGLEMAIGGSFIWILLIVYLLPLMEIIMGLKRWVLPITSFLFLLIVLFLAQLKSDYTENRPLMSNVNYCQNANTGESFWVSSKSYIDRWNSQFFKNAVNEPLKEIFPFARIPRLKSIAPKIDISIPIMTIYSDTVIEQSRILNLNLKSQRGAENMQFFIHKSSGLRSLKVNGKAITDPVFFEKYYNGYHFFNYYGLYESGVDLELECEPDSEFSLVMIEKKLGLPQIEGYDPMPEYIIPDSDYFSNLTLLSKTWVL